MYLVSSIVTFIFLFLFFLVVLSLLKSGIGFNGRHKIEESALKGTNIILHSKKS